MEYFSRTDAVHRVKDCKSWWWNAFIVRLRWCEDSLCKRNQNKKWEETPKIVMTEKNELISVSKSKWSDGGNTFLTIESFWLIVIHIFRLFGARTNWELRKKMHLISSFSFSYLKQRKRSSSSFVSFTLHFFPHFSYFSCCSSLSPLPTSFVSYRLENFIYIFLYIHSFARSLVFIRSLFFFITKFTPFLPLYHIFQFNFLLFIIILYILCCPIPSCSQCLFVCSLACEKCQFTKMELKFMESFFVKFFRLSNIKSFVGCWQS
jgi:hypothetical protein